MTHYQAVSKKNKRPRQRARNAKCLTLSPRETMAYTGLGERRTYRLLKAGVMPSIPDPDGKGYRIPKSALLRWLDGCGGQPAEPALTDIQKGRT
jgi:excisionase family DNA binding protein